MNTSIIQSLRTFARQRPGLEFGNYGVASAYRAEMRAITKDLRDAQILLRALELSSIDEKTLRDAFSAFSGRLSFTGDEVTGYRLDYCTGQYWPTEYRKAVCAVAAAALWAHYRDDFAASAIGTESPGDAIRRNFRRMFGRGVGNRWFS